MGGQEDMREAESEGKSGRNRERKGDRGRGRELAQMRLALTQQDILSHTLHMSSPMLSQKPAPKPLYWKQAQTSNWWNYRYVMVGARKN